MDILFPAKNSHRNHIFGEVCNVYFHFESESVMILEQEVGQIEDIMRRGVIVKKSRVKVRAVRSSLFLIQLLHF